ncbi:PH domain-containing protein [Paenibacillus sp. DMB20]|uniref:PH domain-containing protein n=1 Tax=Paenibacillus sp. DMB20 TaxID=1642570 RepID=UPI001F16E5FE|nr:PH domain-containing protein [Paenibacillus sp. DMB20]
MMSERPIEHRLHKLYILFPLAGIIKPLLPIAALFAFRIFKGDEAKPFSWLWMAAAAAGVAALLLFYGWLRWKRFVYVLEDNKIVIRRGVLFREELSVYTGRIHSMNMEQPLFQRILGLTQVKIDTPGKSEEGGKLPAVSGSEARRLQQWLRERTAAAHDSNAATDRASDSRMAESVLRAAPFPGADTISEAEPMGSVKEPGPIHPAGDESLLPHGKAEDGHAIQRQGGSSPLQAVPAANRHGAPSGPAQSANEPYGGTAAPAEERTVLLRLSAGRLLLAALTSFNLSLALAFAAGVFSFADDILPKNLYGKLFREAGHLMSGGWAAAAAIALLLAWLLSGVLYTIKYAGFTVERVGKQIAVTCGLLERKQMFFSPKRVQAVSVKEGILRQPFGYSEVKLHVLTSDSDKNLVLHPMIRLNEVGELLRNIVPQFSADQVDTRSPRRALWLYLRMEAVVTTVVCAAVIWYFKAPGLWSLLLFPLSLLWSYLTHRDTGIALRGKQLTMRSRTLARHTRYVRRPQIVSLKVTGTRRQRRRQLLSFEVSLISSQYDGKIYAIEQSAVEGIWHWFRRSKEAASEVPETSGSRSG